MESLWSSSWKSDEAAEDLIERLTDADLAAASSDAARSSGKDASRDIMDHDGDNPSSGACDFGKSPVALQQAIDFHRLGQAISHLSLDAAQSITGRNLCVAMRAVGLPVLETDGDSPERTNIELDSLISTVQASRMLWKNGFRDHCTDASERLELQDTRDRLERIKEIVGFSADLEDSESHQLFLQALEKALERGAQVDLILKHRLQGAQAEQLEEINKVFQQDYTIRRQMMIKRSEVTLQSFISSAQVEDQKAELSALAARSLEQMSSSPSVSTDDVYRVSHSDLNYFLARTSNSSARFKASVKSVKIGSVPDRGGRTENVGGMRRSVRPAHVESGNKPNSDGGGKHSARGGRKHRR